MKIIGLTGGIATGKSTVSKMLAQAGFPIVDADLVAREVVEPGTTTLEKIKMAFGANIIDNGVLDRKRLGERIFADPSQRRELDQIIQPAIKSAMEDKIAFWRMQKVPLLIIDLALLFERGYDKTDLFDKIVLVMTDRRIQLERLMARNHLSLAEAEQRVNSQMKSEQKLAGADFVIDNNGNLDDLKQQVDELIAKLQEYGHAQ
ncbi:dephospho-CoA kinase [Eupransor demetentiae]|uniref:Dephospho-CoA kinase n=1 Tax=Eupransor demetentiae TaxID=3109584 RepID=A0ABM9N340_9LACO|nr:Dephospho-CoA kinase (CoaE) [Lactobacillaceae bacterium LMG 33000]